MKTAAFLTFGCKINQYETEALREQVLALGYEEVSPTSIADVYVVNTCSVTAEGFAKSRKSVLRAARTNPLGRILVVGCSTAAEKRKLERIPQVALVAGNEEKRLVASFLSGSWRPGDPAPEVTEEAGISRFAERTRACVKVQDGCNSFCSFCIIPFFRGRSRSRPPDSIVEEVRRLVASGHRELVISGVHVQDFGDDLGDGWTLARLLRRIAEVPGISRIRLSSLGVRAFTEELTETFSDPLFCPHWHIPLQSGSDTVLGRMRRGYTSAEFLDAIARLSRRFDAPSFSTDVIVGYPGESEADFRATVDVCRKAGFSKIHVFPYSRREGTLAWKLGGDLPGGEIRRRVRELLAVERELSIEYKSRFLGSVVQVLVEGKVREGGEATTLEGFTERYVRVRFPVPRGESGDAAAWLERLRGTIRPVRIDGIEPAVARGVLAGGGVKDPETIEEESRVGSFPDRS